jgi:hypothetical protein
MSFKIPYVISEAHPDYKRPYLFDNFGAIDENMIDTFFVETVSEFILDRKDISTISSITDIEDFWNYYYQEYYMENAPWTAMIFIEGKWKSITPSNIEIFECIKRIKNEENRENEEKDEKQILNDNKIEEDIVNFKFTSEEEEIKQKMKEFVESELDKSDLEILSKMNNAEQMIYILNKCFLLISSEKYKANQELFYGFFNIILRCTEKDISLTTEKMEKNYDEETSLKLNYLMNIHASLLEYKNIFNILK